MQPSRVYLAAVRHEGRTPFLLFVRVAERVGHAPARRGALFSGATGRRVNVNRPTEQLIGAQSEVLRQWRSDRAVALNRRYEERVKEAAQGPLASFYELHSNHRPQFAGSIEVSTLGVWRGEAARFKAAFEAAVDGLAAGIPKLAVHVSPIDRVTYPNYRAASTISIFSRKGCAIEHPGRVYSNRTWRRAYAGALATAIGSAPFTPLSR